ncbi:MAG: class I SAM-dependent DNA methyltransferase [Planctomycetota bacterium]
MSELFGPAYASAYDALYEDKNYADECELLVQLFKRYGEFPIRRVLDLGCGTGNHAIPLAERGFEVTGVDRSPEMIAAARAKVGGRSLPLSLHEADIRRADVGRDFDAGLMMFAVLGYQSENADVRSALTVARSHLREGGLLVLDVWYGPAVLAQRPGERVKVVETTDGKILRAASGELDTRRHLCTVRFQLWHLRGSTLVAETTEEHRMRFFFPQELDLFLEVSGFETLRHGAFPDFEREPDENAWNALTVARAI